MQIVLADYLRRFHSHSVLIGKRVHTDESDDFVEIRFLLQDTHYKRSQIHIIGRDVVLKPFAKPVGVKRIAYKPVDSGKVPLVCKRGGKPPEYFDYAQRRLRNRFGKIASRRRYGAD